MFEVAIIPRVMAAAAQKYVQAVGDGAQPLPFVLYVPAGFSKCGEKAVPNVQETTDREKVFRAEFGGQEVW